MKRQTFESTISKLIDYFNETKELLSNAYNIRLKNETSFLMKMHMELSHFKMIASEYMLRNDCYNDFLEFLKNNPPENSANTSDNSNSDTDYSELFDVMNKIEKK